MTDEERPGRPAEGPAGGTDDDAVWAALVESFHRSPSLPDIDDDAVSEPLPKTNPYAPPPAAAREPAEEHYVPPPPPPSPPLAPATRLGWFGTIGGPAFLLLVALVGWEAPRWLIWLAVAGFLAGFVTLVTRMRRQRDLDDDGDNGAVV